MIKSQEDELQERDKTIKVKYKRIIDLKKKTQEHKNFKFVLDYKIKKLKRDIGSREPRDSNLELTDKQDALRAKALK